MRDVHLRVWDPESNDDLALVGRMGLRFIQETPTGALMGGEPTLLKVQTAILQLNEAAPGTVILAFDAAGVCVGFAALLLVENPFTGGLFVDETGIWVEPEARRDTRAGPLLIAASENWARQMGAAMLKMTAPPRSGFGRWLRHQGYDLAEEALIKRF
jgi:hypothetical protein